jgi:hypothetical protein
MVLTITNTSIQPRRAPAISALAACVLAASAACAQQYTPPPPPLTTAPCVATKKNPCDQPPSTTPPAAPDKFPFPGDTPAPASQTPAQTVNPAAPADKFPFPGEPPATPAAPTTPAARQFPFPGEPADSSSSSSSSSYSSSSSDSSTDDDKPALADKGSSGSTRAQRRKLPKIEDPNDREAEDLQVAHYYSTTGNFLAAYNRAKDAVKTIGDDPMAHFALAESAAKLKKTDEAIAEYKLYLKLDPDGEKVKQSQRALAELSPDTPRK